MSDFDFKAYLKERQAVVNKQLETILNSLDKERELTRAMAHSLMAGGKRLRPILCLAACEACGQDPVVALPAASALEMVHTYSLIHDDLPAMDDDDLRRGIPTCHKAFSEATAILAGDGLLTHAFQVLTRPGNLFERLPDPAVRLELTAILSEAAGVDGMIEGQMLDMLSQDRDAAALPSSLDHLEKIHTLKTGMMIKASVLSGAVSAGAGPDTQERLAVYAEKVGLAFQVKDDILDVEGDPAVMGKPAGSDEAKNKMTYPALMGLEPSKGYAEELVNEAVEALNNFDEKALPLRAIAEYILQRRR
ncbi:MAG: polyprenyl synthetase family protein [Desulfobacteraceae bacterium]|nr:polyprenyl synthetase family protein [Desulfobacteraceae bacterium]